MLNEMDLAAFERIMNTALIVESGLIALAGIAYNRWLITNNAKKHQFNSYTRIIANAPHMKGYLDSHRFLLYFMSIMILAGLAYFVFVESMRYGITICGIAAVIEVYFINRFAVVVRGYTSFIDKKMMEESINEFENAKRRREFLGEDNEEDL